MKADTDGDHQEDRQPEFRERSLMLRRMGEGVTDMAAELTAPRRPLGKRLARTFALRALALELAGAADRGRALGARFSDGFS